MCTSIRYHVVSISTKLLPTPIVADPYNFDRDTVRIQDLKKFVTYPDPDRTLKRIRIQIQAKSIGSGFRKKDSVPVKSLKLDFL